MTPTFLLGAAALTILALAFVLRPLWGGSRRTALALLMAVPLLAAGLYAHFGEPDALVPANHLPPTTLEEAIARLEKRLEKSPEDIEGWVLLGRSRKAQEQFIGAAEALARAHALQPDQPDLQVEYAEALSLAAPERRFSDTAVTLLDKALAANPQHPRGLWLRGVAAYQRGDIAGTLRRWEALLPLVEADTASALRNEINTLREGAGLPALAGTEVPAPSPVASAMGVEVSVVVDAELAGRMPPEAVLFVFARRPEAPAGPPLAAKRIPNPRFPLSVRLTDADSPMPAGKLSDVSRVAISARWAASGSVQASEGDLVAAGVEVDLIPGARAELQLDAPSR